VEHGVLAGRERSHLIRIAHVTEDYFDLACRIGLDGAKPALIAAARVAHDRAHLETECAEVLDQMTANEPAGTGDKTAP
jgi:hypothetical protein